MTTLGHVDLLAIGPHPDDIEIGIGGSVARHSALGFRVGLCGLYRLGLPLVRKLMDWNVRMKGAMATPSFPPGRERL